MFFLFRWVRDREVSSDRILILVVLWYAQILFALSPGVCIGCKLSSAFPSPLLFLLLTTILLIAFLIWAMRTRFQKYLILPLMICLIATTVYSEWYNGIETFDSSEEFRAFERDLKDHYHLFPFKVIDRSDRQRSEADLLYLPEMFGRFLTPTPIMRQEGKLYYYLPKGIGETGRWFEYGKPRGPQIL